MGLKERYNSDNPDIELIPQNGWWIMRMKSIAPEAELSIGVLRREGHEWGYWDINDQGEKEWIVITVPEQDPAKIKEIPNYYEMGRTIGYIAQEIMPDRLKAILWESCPSVEARVECLRGVVDARTYWELPQVEVDEADL